MKGLLLAEMGDGMVQLDVNSGFVKGPRITSDAVTPGGGLRIDAHETVYQVGNIARHGTLITENASPERIAEELQRLLGNSNARLKSGGTLLPPPGANSFENVQMEQAKPRARIEVDVVLESNVFVQGGIMKGHAVVNVRKPTKKEGPVMIFGGKIRVIGFESISGTKSSHSFYQHSSPIANGTYFDDPHTNQEEPTEAIEGTYLFPFSTRLSPSDKGGCPKGIVYGLSGAEVRYIAVVSFKLKDAFSRKRSIAHFYRACEVWPRLDTEKILVPAPRPLRATTSKTLFMAGDGKLTLMASLIRLYWVSGQRCFIHMDIQNETKKAVTSVTLFLLRNTVVFRPHPQLDASFPSRTYYNRDPDACQTATTTKVIAESVLEAGDRAVRGYASAKGWWTGVPSKTSLKFSHSIVIPPGEVSLPRSRLLEVEYILKVSLSTGALLSSDVQVSLPIRLVNFLSLDPYINYMLNPTLKHGAPHPTQGSTISISPEDELGHRSASMDKSATLDDDSDLEEDLDTVLPGDSPMADMPEEVVRRAIASARIDQTYGGRAPRFADLYYACLQDDQTITEVVDMSKRPSIERAERFSNEQLDMGSRSRSDTLDGLELKISRSGKDIGHTSVKRTRTTSETNCDHADQAMSSFAHRVEDKLRATYKTKSRSSASSSNASRCESPVDELISEMADLEKTSNKSAVSKDLPTRDNAMEATGLRQTKMCQTEIRAKSGLVKSKIQELEKRFSAGL
ncbi:hypothetical protein APHAL10511_006005 [Amanita phalloides]|nr:hypothetical protein APHAL10511_006005 [Amanita phalloides]